METGGTGSSGRHHFSIGALLGSGTFGDVYLARMTTGHGIEQEVAVKLLNPGISPKSQPVARMRDEGRMLAALNHPNILQVMDFCVLDGRTGLVTEYVQGSDLHDCVYAEAPLSPRAATHVVGLVADALHAAWHTPNAAGRPMQLVHRDIKPANVRLTPHGTVKLLDFGIAKSDDEHRETATQQRMAIGTPSYMAPEALTYEVLEALPSRDVFALGCTLYEAFAHELYYEGLDHQEITRLSNKTERFMEWRSTRMPRLMSQDPRTIELVSRMLRYNHAERPTAREVADTCLMVAERGQGASLWAWCRSHDWPEPRHNSGPWTGRKIDDAAATLVEGSSVSGSVSAQPAATPRPASANPTIIAPEHLRKGSSVTVVRTSADGQPTEVVIVHEGGKPARGRRLADALMLIPAFVMITAAGLWMVDPSIVQGLLHGDTSALAAGGGGKAWRKVMRTVGQADTAAEKDSDDHRRKRGGASSSAQTRAEPKPTRRILPGSTVTADGAGSDAAEVFVDGQWAVGVKPEGGAMVGVPPNGSARVPPGQVEVYAKFGFISRYELQFTADIESRARLHIVCDADTKSCDPR